MRRFLHRFLCGLMWGHDDEQYGEVAAICRHCGRTRWFDGKLT